MQNLLSEPSADYSLADDIQTPKDPREPVLECMYHALEGLVPWTGPVPERMPAFEDITAHGHALIVFDGERQASRPCIDSGCGLKSNLAWLVQPIEFTVAACSGQCVANAVEALWIKHRDCSVFVRDFGRRAFLRDAMVQKHGHDPEVTE